MKQEIKESLILELTKTKVGRQHIDNPTNSNLTNAEFWIESYLMAVIRNEKDLGTSLDLKF